MISKSKNKKLKLCLLLPWLAFAAAEHIDDADEVSTTASGDEDIADLDEVESEDGERNATVSVVAHFGAGSYGIQTGSNVIEGTTSPANSIPMQLGNRITAAFGLEGSVYVADNVCVVPMVLVGVGYPTSSVAERTLNAVRASFDVSIGLLVAYAPSSTQFKEMRLAVGPVLGFTSTSFQHGTMEGTSYDALITSVGIAFRAGSKFGPTELGLQLVAELVSPITCQHHAKVSGGAPTSVSVSAQVHDKVTQEAQQALNKIFYNLIRQAESKGDLEKVMRMYKAELRNRVIAANKPGGRSARLAVLNSSDKNKPGMTKGGRPLVKPAMSRNAAMKAAVNDSIRYFLQQQMQMFHDGVGDALNSNDPSLELQLLYMRILDSIDVMVPMGLTAPSLESADIKSTKSALGAKAGVYLAFDLTALRNV